MGSSMLNNNISISVPDDDDEDPSTRVRAPARRKRKKLGPRGRPDLTRIIFSKLFKWWPALLLLLAVALLVYEAFKIGGSERRSPPRYNITGNVATQGSNTKPLGNLNKLEPTTRVVGGVRERASYFFLSVLPCF